MAGRELFVWYRVRRERAEEARNAVLAMQQTLCGCWPGLQARLLVRAEGETATWMETYSRAPADTPAGVGTSRGIDREIEAAIAAAAASRLAALVDGTRHVEAFDDAT